MPRRKKVSSENQTELLDITPRLRTAPCVPALREAVKAWAIGGYKGITDTTRLLLNHWFYTDHKLPNGTPFKYHRSQQEAIETLIFLWEYEKVRSRKALLERYAQDLRSYYPDFVAVDEKQTRWILETKGAEYEDVGHKGRAAIRWCENATQLTGVRWSYLKIPQKAFQMLQPARFRDLEALCPVQ